MKKVRVRASAVIAAIILTAGLTVAADANQVPQIETSIENVLSTWHQEDGAARYPLMVTYDAVAVTRGSDGIFSYEEDTYGETQFLHLRDLSPDAGEDASTRWALRGRVEPGLEPTGGLGLINSQLGTRLHFNQGAVGDMYFWAAAAKGAQSVDGDRHEQVVLNTGMPVVFPRRDAGAATGHLEWDHAIASRSPTSRMLNPITGQTRAATLYAELAASQLKVVGGDLIAQAATNFSLTLPDGISPSGALAVYPTGLPGVSMELSLTRPNRPQELNVSVVATPDSFWPESTASGNVHEWVWSPVIASFGSVYSTTQAEGAAILEAPIPAGFAAATLDRAGTFQNLEVPAQGGLLRIVERHGIMSTSITPNTSMAESGPTPSLNSSCTTEGSRIETPSVGTFKPAGLVSFALRERQSVPVVECLEVAGRIVGDLAVPTLRVDGNTVALDGSRLIAGPIVQQHGFGNTGGGFHGAEVRVRMAFATSEVMVEISITGTVSNFWSKTDLFVHDAHPIDGVPHTIEIDWWSRPDADTYTASDLSLDEEIRVPIQFNGDIQNRNRPDVVATDTTRGPWLRYFQLAPVLLWNLDPNAADTAFVLVIDHGTFASEPDDEVDGEALLGPVALYSRMRFEGMPPASGFRGLIMLTDPAQP